MNNHLLVVLKFIGGSEGEKQERDSKDIKDSCWGKNLAVSWGEAAAIPPQALQPFH